MDCKLINENDELNLNLFFRNIVQFWACFKTLNPPYAFLTQNAGKIDIDVLC